jgi:hypothetical protein
MLYLLRILRKCRKLKNKYIIVMSINTNTNPNPNDSNMNDDDSDSNEKLTPEQEEQDKEALIEQLQKELDGLYNDLLAFQEPINKIYDENQKENFSELKPEDQDKINEYETIYNHYREIIQKISDAEHENKGLFATFILDPLKKTFNGFFENLKKGSAKAITGSFRFGTEIFARSMEEMKSSLEKIQKIKAEIAAAGKRAEAEAMAGIPKTGLETGLTPGLESGLESGLTPGLETGLEVKGGGRHSNIKEVQKGGAAAAKRAENSIKQFLDSSVTSSHILNMVKRKTKAKRRRNGKRYSRKRARK